MKLPIRLVWRNLAKHKLRALLTMGSLFVALFLLCVLRSLVVTLDRGVKNARSDRVIVQSAVSLFVELPNSYLDKIKNVEGVQDVCGWNWFSGNDARGAHGRVVERRVGEVEADIADPQQHIMAGVALWQTDA